MLNDLSVTLVSIKLDKEEVRIMEDETKSERDQYIIDQYKQQEQTMILIFCQWCQNHALDPVKLYHEAYPAQMTPNLLLEIIDETTTDSDAIEIDTEIVLEVLQQFGNDDLAFVVSEYAAKLKKQQR